MAYGLAWSCTQSGLEDTARALFNFRSQWILLSFQAEPIDITVSNWAKNYVQYKQVEPFSPEYALLARAPRAPVWAGERGASAVALQTGDWSTFEMFFDGYWLGEEHVCIMLPGVSDVAVEVAVKRLAECRDDYFQLQVDTAKAPELLSPLSIWFGAPSSDSSNVLVVSGCVESIDRIEKIALDLGHLKLRDFSERRAPWANVDGVNAFYRCDPVLELMSFRSLQGD